jgi:hypothetical protein
MSLINTTAQICAFFEELVGETVDETTKLHLAEHAKDLIEGDRPWAFLLKEDATKTFGTSDNYLTAKALPADFESDHKVYLGDATLKDFYEYNAVPFHLRRKFNDSSYTYYIDYANSNLYICGSVDKTYTIYLYYIYKTPALDLSTSDPVWPAKFRKLIAFIMAKVWRTGIDIDEITVKQAVSDSAEAKMLYQAFVDWDAKIKLRQLNNRTGFASEKNSFSESGRVNFND